MSLGSHLQLDRGAYLAPMPAFAVDGRGRIEDANVAAQVLFGRRVDDCRQASLGALCAELGIRNAPPASVASAFMSAGDQLGGYRSEDYGLIQFRWSTFPILRSREGEDDVGAVVFFALHSIADESDYFEKLGRAIAKQVTWDVYARSYDSILPRLPFYQEAVRRHLDAMMLPHVASVLDVGAGTGNVTVALARAGRMVTAVELNRSMADRLNGKVSSSISKNVVVLEQNAESLRQFSGGSFDGLTILLALYDADDPDRMLTEALRVLRPGASIIVTEPKQGFTLDVLLSAGEEHLKRSGEWPLLREHWMRVFRANKDRDPSRRAGRLFAEDVAARFANAGVEDISVRASHLGQCATIAGRMSAGRGECAEASVR